MFCDSLLGLQDLQNQSCKLILSPHPLIVPRSNASISALHLHLACYSCVAAPRLAHTASSRSAERQIESLFFFSNKHQYVKLIVAGEQISALGCSSAGRKHTFLAELAPMSYWIKPFLISQIRKWSYEAEVISMSGSHATWGWAAR